MSERKKKPVGPPKPWDYLGWQGDQPTIDDLPGTGSHHGPLAQYAEARLREMRSYWNRWDAGEPMADLFHEAEAEIARLKEEHVSFVQALEKTQTEIERLRGCASRGGDESGEVRSQNEIAQAIIDLDPRTEPLVEEWFVVLTRVHRNADRRLADAVQALELLLSPIIGSEESVEAERGRRLLKARTVLEALRAAGETP